jgi:tungstate transport system ATP-binding protein
MHRTTLPLRLERVGFAARGAVLLSGLTLRVERQRRTVVIGPNGAGKSLLLRLCHGLLAPSEGRILCNGGTEGVGPDVRARQAMVFQRPVHLRRSAFANLTYALGARGVPRPQRRARAMATLERFGLGRLADRPARVLSGGEQQRLALARAWLLEPELLLLDEPTAALDPSSTKAVEGAINLFAREGVTIVMTTHDLGQARRHADEVVFLAGGRLIEQGPAAEFFDRPRTPEARAFLKGELVL